MMPKVALIGAGSVVFANSVLGDLLTFEELKDELHFSLMDIDADRLNVSEGCARRRIQYNRSKATVEATPDLDQALEKADYVINMVQVGGLEATRVDFNVPARYGLKQTIADTHGIGGVFRALRTIPVVLDICGRMEKLCPEALLINYSNPMAMNVWAAYEASPIHIVGLCHSIQLTAAMLANYLDLPYPALRFKAAGINHICWYLELTHQGEDVYPQLFEAAKDAGIYASDRVRFEIMKYFGRFVSESSEHMAEYVPYFIPRENLIEELHIPINEYLARCEYQNDAFEKNRELAAGKGEMYEHYRSYEYAAPIINAMETHRPICIHGNVKNTGIITNLPEGCCVEVPCLVDRNGIQPVHVGNLPPQLAAINRSHVSIQELAVRAALEKRREYVYYACQLDPLASAMLPLDRIRALADDLFNAHAGYLSYLK
ncbi:MAG: alpha-glucosidase/alpha-galactosidase [Bacillota bacterium]